MIKNTTPQQIVDEIFELYDQFGAREYIGEPVSQLEHMAQTATMALKAGCDDEVVLASFFHDLGHLCDPGHTDMDGFGKANHEQLGAHYLKERGFSERVIYLVESHVAAKRYLTAKFAEYYQQLSEASRETLAWQGGKMSPEEVLDFETNPDAGLIIKLRTWDDRAKEEHIPIGNLQLIKDMALKHLHAQGKPEQR